MMSNRKNASSKSAAKPAAKPVAKPVVSNEVLREEIKELKKQVEALSGQCHSCCADLKQIKDKTQDDSASALSNLLANSTSFAQFKHFAKKLAK